MSKHPDIIKVFKLIDTTAEQDYRGCGWSVLVVRHGEPTVLIYAPTDAEDFETAYKKGCFSIRLEDEAKPYTEIYFGMASCYEFCAMVKLC